jgi:hypothetical protein
MPNGVAAMQLAGAWTHRRRRFRSGMGRREPREAVAAAAQGAGAQRFAAAEAQAAAVAIEQARGLKSLTAVKIVIMTPKSPPNAAAFVKHYQGR